MSARKLSTVMKSTLRSFGGAFPVALALVLALGPALRLALALVGAAAVAFDVDALPLSLGHPTHSTAAHKTHEASDDRIASVIARSRSRVKLPALSRGATASTRAPR
jgi:hypothetical protein